MRNARAVFYRPRKTYRSVEVSLRREQGPSGPGRIDGSNIAFRRGLFMLGNPWRDATGKTSGAEAPLIVRFFAGVKTPAALRHEFFKPVELLFLLRRIRHDMHVVSWRKTLSDQTLPAACGHV